MNVTIGDLAETIRGVTYEKAEARSSPREGYSPLIRATNIENGALVLDSFVYVPAVVIRDDQRLRVGDIVLAASSGSLSVVGKAALVRGQWAGTFGAFCYVVRPQPDRVVPDYLAYFMQTSAYRSRVSTLAAGVNINNLRREHIENIDLPYCALAEQQRIVEAIDSYLTRLDAAVASLERVQAKLKAYRSSVLKAAVEGRLVPTEASVARAEKRAYEPAEALLARILKHRRRRWEEAELAKLKAAGKTPKDDKWKAKYQEPVASDTSTLPELPEGWCWARLDAVSDVILGQQRSPAHSAAELTMPYIRAANITWAGLDLSDVKRMGFVNPDRHRLDSGDVLLSEASGSPMEAGKPAIWRGEIPGACFQNTVLRVRPLDKATILPEFLRLVFLRDCVTGQFARLAPGVGIVHIGAERLAQWSVPLASLPEQRRIVEEVARVLSVADQNAVNVEHDIKRCIRLRQAVLKWAFEGKLADQDPADEPAEKLLARIRAERAADAPVRKNGGSSAKGAA